MDSRGRRWSNGLLIFGRQLLAAAPHSPPTARADAAHRTPVDVPAGGLVWLGFVVAVVLVDPARVGGDVVAGHAGVTAVAAPAAAVRAGRLATGSGLVVRRVGIVLGICGVLLRHLRPGLQRPTAWGKRNVGGGPASTAGPLRPPVVERHVTDHAGCTRRCRSPCCSDEHGRRWNDDADRAAGSRCCRRGHGCRRCGFLRQSCAP